MNAMQRKAIYDEMCGLLTDYEGMNGPERADEVGADDLYDMLVKIQNNWDDIIVTEE